MTSAVTWPLERNVIRKHLISNTFGMVRKRADGSPKPHQGWDLEARVGTPAYAIGDGKVVFVHFEGDYGHQLCMSFQFQSQVYFAFYAHMRHLWAGAGQEVTLGQEIGTTGKTGNASNLPVDEEHLHFEIRTVAQCGLGLPGRVSPLVIYGSCPLHVPILGRISGLASSLA
jgi:murein DD-endopeptidase MepM/ murein hydrolase activator NlpD